LAFIKLGLEWLGDCFSVTFLIILCKLALLLN